MKATPLQVAAALHAFDEVVAPRWPEAPSLALRVEAMRAALESVPAVEDATGWLVANGSDAAMYRTMEQGMIIWTPDPEKALRLARRRDAELFSEEDEDAWRVVTILEARK